MRDQPIEIGTLGKPIRPGYTRACPFCDSSQLVICGKALHIHVMCAACRAFGPVLQKGSRAQDAIAAWELRAPGPDLAARALSPIARKFWKSVDYRFRKNRRKLAPCPFCGDAGPGFIEEGVLSYRMYVACFRCDAQGPYTNGRVDARLLWNQAHKAGVAKWLSGWEKWLIGSRSGPPKVGK